MKIQNVFILILFNIMLTAGQLLFRKTGLELKNLSEGQVFFYLARNPLFFLSLALYGAATLLWIWILSRIPLSQAYPTVAIAIALVPLASHILFKETVAPLYWVGIVLIILGVIITQLNVGRS